MNSRGLVQVTVTGAAGQISYALLFRIASGAVFGENTDIVLRCLELPQAMKALDAVAMELTDCAFPCLKDLICTDDVKHAMHQSDWALLVGAAPRRPGMERADLLRANAGIFEQHGQAFNDHAATGARMLVVGNPCNTNAFIAKRHAPDRPARCIYAMTTLDELRARALLAKKCSVPVSAITQMAVWGNHSATQFPYFEQAQIHNRPYHSWQIEPNWLAEAIPAVQQRGAEILRAKGSSSAASAAHAIVQSVRALTQPETDANDYFSMVLCSEGEYGVDPGLFFSFPVRKINNQLTVVPDIPLNTHAKARLQVTLDELREERDAV